ncbi:MAG: 3-phosphoshikimate 1-carboxyvinyltransferase, partial [Planctomycetaceae bacterium]|jgi:3-phosphoshikimate 1-carboxyvinyltransferase|nr:3-phosphoshikimate 1-carboxyvinyltransferase [Planctomycetaceae bacterium]
MTGTLSSQYVSGILLASPLAARNCPVEFHVVNQLSGDPYLLMTLDVMKEFGVEVPIQTGGDENPLFSKGTTYVIPQGVTYRPHIYQIEPDASLANYAFAAVAIAGGRVTVKNLTDKSIQKELEFIYCLQRMGCRISFSDQSVTVERGERSLLRGVSVDMFDMVDSIQTFAVCALFAASPSRVTNIGHIRRREPDRLPKLLLELRRFGANINEFEDGFLIVPRKYLNPSTIDAEGDARLAMSLGLIGLKVGGVRIDSADCVQRAWPTFFNDIGLQY